MIDLANENPSRLAGLNPKLMAESEDETLASIVREAAADLGAPMAMVSLVLDQIQFFKAHTGLPDDLAASRGLRREASFCQFVVRDGATFEVIDAAEAETLPQHIVEDYGIRSYLGVPISVGDQILGALCVLDTKPREFDQNERTILTALAKRVNTRLEELNRDRHEARRRLSEDATSDALQELGDALDPMSRSIDAAIPSLSALRSFFRLAEYIEEGGRAMPNAMGQALAAARDALASHEASLHELDAALADCRDTIQALEHLRTNELGTSLSEIVRAAQDLSRRNTRRIGGAPMPDLPEDPVIHTPRPLAVALVTTCLNELARKLGEAEESSGIRIEYRRSENAEELLLRASALSETDADELVSTLSEQLGTDPSVRLDPIADGLRIRFIAS